MPVSEQAVMDALRTVNDPDLKRDLVTLNMVRDVKVSQEGEVSLTVMLTTPACPLKGQIESDVKAAVMRVPGVKRVSVNMGSNVSGMLRPMDLARGVRNIVGVASGKGGVGKSTVSVNLAVALARSGARVGLLDADIYGPNVPLMLGLAGHQPEVITVPDHQGGEIEMIRPLEAHGIKVMSMGFLIGEDTPVIWRGPMLNSALRQFLGQVDWGDLDYLIVDLPPGTGDVQISLIQLVKVTGIVHVTTPQAVAVQDVRKGVMMFQSQNIPLLGIIENMSHFVAPGTSEPIYIFGKGGGRQVAETYGLRFLGEIPMAVEIREGGDQGTPIVVARPDSPTAQTFIRIAEQLASQISIENFAQAGRQGAAV